MLAYSFEEIWIGAKVIPGHGVSANAVRRLRAMGCAVHELSGKDGRLSLTALAQWLRQVPFGPETVFLCVGMRYLPPLLSLLVRPSHSVYYHITHELTEACFRRLDVYRRCFSTLLFVCPATFHAFAQNRPKAKNLDWVIQASECEDFVWHDPKTSNDGIFRFGFSSRLNEAKGSKLLLEFARNARVSCELHVAGEGEFREEFEQLAADSASPVKVIYHGTFLPSERGMFVTRVFTPLDCMCVPSLDDLEGFPTVVLEALQAGVPVQTIPSGGLVSYGLPELGPPDAEVVELVPVDRFIERMEARVLEGCIKASQRIKCRKYFLSRFSDFKVREGWARVLGLGTAAPLAALTGPACP